MDFFKIMTADYRGKTQVFPDFRIGRNKDLMIRGKSFYAIWDEAEGMWSTDEYDVVRLVDESMDEFAKSTSGPYPYSIKYMRSNSSRVWKEFKSLLRDAADNSKQLDMNLTFFNTEVKRNDYVSKRLPYSLVEGDYSAWDELVGTLYRPEERAKIEWAIGAIVAGDAKKIQKFMVFYGSGGTGKSTILNIIQQLFDGYSVAFEANSLGSSNGSFSTEPFKSNPLVAIQHDGDLSKITDNTKLNSIISHEEMTFNEKYKPSYAARANAFLFMGTNQPVKISDSKSGIIRRLIDVHPSGAHIPIDHYQFLLDQILFQLGPIAHHCLEVYRAMGKNYYNNYRPFDMMYKTDVFFNFIEYYYDTLKKQDGVSLKQAYSMYKEFCAETGVDKPLPRHVFRTELGSYFREYHDRVVVDGSEVRSYFKGFNSGLFRIQDKDDSMAYSLVLDETVSLLDETLKDLPAQYANAKEWPKKPWDEISTKLGDLDTSKLHFVKVPEQHVVIDFDIKDENGEKSLEKNLAAASVWPATYAELSKGGAGVHLHYNYVGDTSDLASVFSDGIEVKTLHGDAALRRRVTRCNNVPVATLTNSLPIKEKKVLASTTMQSEKGLRDLIRRNLRKEIHSGTKPSVDFIAKILDDAYASGMVYDVTDLRSTIVAFANNSSNQPLQALKIVQRMKWKSENQAAPISEPTDDKLVIFDVEVYPNLFVVCWSYEDSETVVRMINPTPQEVEALFKFKLVGFFNRRYDNHILYARYMGYDNEQLWKLSQKLTGKNDVNAMFGEAYSLSYADIYDFSSIKQGLKKFEIDLGLHHMELDLPYDQPVPPEMVEKVVEYCVNDVVATKAVLKDRHQDFVARQILAELSGLTVNDTTARHTAKILFGDEKHPQQSFVYTDLSMEFPGYKYDMGQSTYRDELVGEGGLVRGKPGLYANVAVLDVASMHPTTIQILNLFGDFTPKYAELVRARLAIKRKDYKTARSLLGGRLKQFLGDDDDSEALAFALKIVVNIVYGLTSAKFDNPFRDIRNKDNIVAKRGALFMIDLMHAVEEQGFQVVHIKTDSIKIPDATPEIIDFVKDFGQKYGYEFELEGVYDKFCLVNDAVYIARKGDEWTAVGAQFAHPYVYKTLFTEEPFTFEDLGETKHILAGGMYLDFEHDRPAVLADGMHFVGRTGLFIPVKAPHGAKLYKILDGKRTSITGTKDWLWLEAEMVKGRENEIEIDWSYYDSLAEKAIKAIDKVGSYEELKLWH